jgi:hypothetical protein
MDRSAKPRTELARLAGELSDDLRATAGATLEEVRVSSLKEDIQLRKKYAKGFFGLLAALDVAVILLVVLVGLGWLRLEKDVLMALIGATVVQSGSITFFITKYLFPAA